MAKPRSSWFLFTLLVVATLALVAAMMLAEAAVTARSSPGPDAIRPQAIAMVLGSLAS